MLQEYLSLPRPVHILCAGAMVNRAGSFVLVFLTIYVSEQLELGVAFATRCIGVFGIGSILASIIGGHLADRIGRRVVMLTSLFGGAAMLMILSTRTSPGSVLAAVGLFALLAEMYRPAASAMLGDLATVRQRPYAFGLMYIAVNLGFAIAPPIGGVLAAWSWRCVFVVDTLTMVLFGLLICVWIRETRPDTDTATVLPDGLHADTENRPNAAESVCAGHHAISITDGLRGVARDRLFLQFLLATFLMAAVFMQAMSTLPIYIRQCGFTDIEFGLLVSINGWLIVAFQLPLTHALNRYNHMWIIVAGGVLVSIGIGLTMFAQTWMMLTLTISIWTFGEILQAAFKSTVITNLAPVRFRGLYLGLTGVCISLAITIGGPLGGVILENYGAPLLWGACSLIGLLAVLIEWLLIRQVTERIRLM